MASALGTMATMILFTTHTIAYSNGIQIIKMRLNIKTSTIPRPATTPSATLPDNVQVARNPKPTASKEARIMVSPQRKLKAGSLPPCSLLRYAMRAILMEIKQKKVKKNRLAYTHRGGFCGEIKIPEIKARSSPISKALMTSSITMVLLAQEIPYQFIRAMINKCPNSLKLEL